MGLKQGLYKVKGMDMNFMRVLLAVLIISTGFTNFSFSEESVVAKDESLQKAIFAGGCFWCMEASLEKIKGVKDVISGYTGGSKKNPTYAEVSTGTTGHYEAVEVTYDPNLVSYKKILDIYWQNIDPAAADGQFADKGTQYRTAIFYHTEEQKRLAEESKQKMAQTSQFKDLSIVTKILEAKPFYPAESYHQDYYKKKPVQYQLYKTGSGREEYLNKMWGKDRTH